GTVGPVVDSTPEAEIQQVRVNVEAVIDLSTRAAQQMVPRGRGVSGLAGERLEPRRRADVEDGAATKAFVRSYTDGLRSELDGTGVTVTALHPGPVRTEFLSVAG
ncbi:oxidoreductase, partial [Mycobacterium sp. ITM-2017-0098]